MKKHIIDLALFMVCLVGFIVTIIDDRWLITQQLWIIFSIPPLLSWAIGIKTSYPIPSTFEVHGPLIWRLGMVGFLCFLAFGMIMITILQIQNDIDIFLGLGAVSAIISTGRIAVLGVINGLIKYDGDADNYIKRLFGK